MKKHYHPVPSPGVGEALVYFVQDDSYFTTQPPKPSTLVGIDGKWMGATHANTYFYFAVEPDDHHLCTRWQGFSLQASVHTGSALRFRAQAGETYYFRVSNYFNPGQAAKWGWNN